MARGKNVERQRERRKIENGTVKMKENEILGNMIVRTLSFFALFA